MKPGEHRLRGAASLAVEFGPAVLDPEKPIRPPLKHADECILLRCG